MPQISKLFNAKVTCFVLITIWTFAFWPTIARAFHMYLHSGYDYQGLLVLPILGLMIMHNSANIKRASLGYSPLGLLLLLLSGCVCLVATLVELELVRQFAMISMLFAIVLTTYGRNVTHIILLPLFSLFLLLPLGQEIYQIVEHSFSWLLMQALMLSKQAVYWEANQIYINNLSYDIQAYLSSMHYLMLFITVGAAYATLRTRSMLAALTIIACCITMPIIILGLSLYSYIMLKQWFSISNFIESHITAIGWILTCIGLAHAFWVGLFLKDRKDFIPRNDNIAWRDNYFFAGQHSLKLIVLASCIILAMPMLGQKLKTDLPVDDANLPQIPNTIAAWNNSNKKQLVVNSKSTLFKKDQNSVHLAISHHNQQLEPAWKKIKESSKKIRFGQHKLPVHEIIFNNKNKYKIYWSFKFINGHVTTNETMAKALTHFYSISDKNVKHGIVTISTDATKELNFARDRLKDFLQDFTESNLII